MLDVDRMKRILDIHGMPTGDHVLVALADHLHQVVGDRVIRFGGDEMLILADNDNVEELARAVVQSTHSLEVTTIESPNTRVPVTVSAGVARGQDALAILFAAEEALHQAKLRGRDQFVVAQNNT